MNIQSPSFLNCFMGSWFICSEKLQNKFYTLLLVVMAHLQWLRRFPDYLMLFTGPSYNETRWFVPVSLEYALLFLWCFSISAPVSPVNWQVRPKAVLPSAAPHSTCSYRSLNYRWTIQFNTWFSVAQILSQMLNTQEASNSCWAAHVFCARTHTSPEVLLETCSYWDSLVRIRVSARVGFKVRIRARD